MRSMALRRELVAPHPARDDRLATVDSLLPMLSSGSLLGGGRELVITHAGERYYLRLTRQNRLILTK